MSWSIKEIRVEGIPSTEKSKISVTVNCGATTYNTSKGDVSTNFHWTVNYALPSGLDELIFFHVVRCRKFLVCFMKKEVMGNSLERASDLVERISQSGTDTIKVDMSPVGPEASSALALTIKLVNTETAGSTSDDTGLLGSTNSGVSQLDVNIPSGDGDLLSTTQLGGLDAGKGS
ncbi:hypothetical protein VNI00_010475 [Paramarasmius palmivorus]|uniref:Uncharacterized protein n=1 Tax=Paramarasmius palmivorus TaxID=297713 RepID=A0AAW0CJ89_9AGAR